jgi:hypothetical protein
MSDSDLTLDDFEMSAEDIVRTYASDFSDTDVAELARRLGEVYTAKISIHDFVQVYQRHILFNNIREDVIIKAIRVVVEKSQLTSVQHLLKYAKLVRIARNVHMFSPITNVSQQLRTIKQILQRGMDFCRTSPTIDYSIVTFPTQFRVDDEQSKSTRLLDVEIIRKKHNIYQIKNNIRRFFNFPIDGIIDVTKTARLKPDGFTPDVKPLEQLQRLYYCITNINKQYQGYSDALQYFKRLNETNNVQFVYPSINPNSGVYKYRRLLVDLDVVWPDRFVKVLGNLDSIPLSDTPIQVVIEKVRGRIEHLYLFNKRNCKYSVYYAIVDNALRLGLDNIEKISTTIITLSVHYSYTDTRGTGKILNNNQLLYFINDAPVITLASISKTGDDTINSAHVKHAVAAYKDIENREIILFDPHGVSKHRYAVFPAFESYNIRFQSFSPIQSIEGSCTMLSTVLAFVLAFQGPQWFKSNPYVDPLYVLLVHRLFLDIHTEVRNKDIDAFVPTNSDIALVFK